MSSFKTEFPDYPEADMPPLPEGFSDTSWRQDNCPSYTSPLHLIWIDYLDPEKREMIGTARFIVCNIEDDDTETILETDNWADVLECVADEATVESICAKLRITVLTDDSVPRAGRLYHILEGDHRVKVVYSKDEVRDYILTRKEA